MKRVVVMVAIAVILCLLVGMSVLPNSASAQGKSEILLYYGNGGYDPGGISDYYDLQARYESQGYIVNYTDVWPSDFSALCLIILITPGDDNDDGTYYFSTAQVNELEGFILADGRLVVLGDYNGIFGINTVNNLLGNLGVDITQNSDEHRSTFSSNPATDITTDQITNGMSSMQFASSSSLDLSGDAKSLVREPTDGLTLIAVDQIAGAPARPCYDVVVSGDSNIMTDNWFDDGDGDNLMFIDNLAGCCDPYTPMPTIPPPPSPVPTLSQWGMIGMAMVLAACLVWSVRRRWVTSAGKS